LKLSLVAAVARGGVIGRDGTIPWRIPEDARRFREVTIGHPVVMGRRTWESLPDRFRPLPGRRNVVVTRNEAWHDDGAERAGSLEEALGLLEGAEVVSVIGGAQVYADALPLADELLLNEIDLDVEGDTFFPSWDRAEFDELSREEHVTEDGIPFAFVTYARRAQPRPRA
jgi:dihydrofolate reductase